MAATHHRVNNIGGRRSGADRRVFADTNYQGFERRIAQDRRKGIRNRRYPRLRAKDLTFVKRRFEKDEDIGQLLDISREGLALRYFVYEEKKRDYSELGIFLAGGNFTIDGIPFKTASDTALAERSPFSTLLFRRYGVQFQNLTPAQTSRLDYFLLNHTSGEA